MITWPATEWETHAWVPDSPNMSTRERVRQTGNFDAAFPPAISTETPQLDHLAAELEDATLRLRRCHDRAAESNRPLPLILLCPEAASSSRIEAITASARAVAEASLGASNRRNANLVVANVRALTMAIDSAADLDAAAILRSHRALFTVADGSPAVAGFEPGQWRTGVVWIGKSNHGPVGAEFVAPLAPRVAELMDDLVRFARRSDIPAIAHAAIAHAQFETIHPFPDGNGRIGRALIHAMLTRSGITPDVALPLSAGLLTDLGAYFDALERYRAGDAEPIVRAFIAAANAATDNVSTLLDDIERIRTGWAKSLRMRSDSNAWKVLDVLAELNVVDSAVLAEKVGISKSNALRALRPLVESGIVVESSGQKRNRIWRVPAMIRAYDDFAERAGRRRLP